MRNSSPFGLETFKFYILLFLEDQQNITPDILQFVFKIENFILLLGQGQYYLRQNNWFQVEAAHTYRVASSKSDVSVYLCLPLLGNGNKMNLTETLIKRTLDDLMSTLKSRETNYKSSKLDCIEAIQI